MARVMAEMILRREWKRPKRRITRRARRDRTKPVGSLVTAMERRDMITMKQSSQDLRRSPRLASAKPTLFDGPAAAWPAGVVSKDL